MKHPHLPVVFVALLVLGLVVLSVRVLPGADAASGPFRCGSASLYFPAVGIVGWTYQDPAGTDTDPYGNRTIHTGVDIFGEGGDGAPIYAPADGFVSRGPGSESVNIVLPSVLNVLTGEPGIELYLSHLRHSLSAGDVFHAGQVIGVQEGDHLHFSVGAFVGYDDRVIGQTQDPSPYFSAALAYHADRGERRPVAHWCFAVESAMVQQAAPVALEYVVQAGDTLSGIAETFGTTVDAIAEANSLDELDYLSIGQTLTIPGSAPGPGSPPAESPSDLGAEGSPALGSQPSTYVVADGDTLWSIAEMLGTDVETIIELNGLDQPDVLAIGDELLIP